MIFRYTPPINIKPNKVVAVFDKPDSCELCPCSYYTEGEKHDFCQLAGYGSHIEEYTKSVPDWCPLIEVKTT